MAVTLGSSSSRHLDLSSFPVFEKKKKKKLLICQNMSMINGDRFKLIDLILDLMLNLISLIEARLKNLGPERNGSERTQIIGT